MLLLLLWCHTPPPKTKYKLHKHSTHLERRAFFSTPLRDFSSKLGVCARVGTRKTNMNWEGRRVWVKQPTRVHSCTRSGND